MAEAVVLATCAEALDAILAADTTIHDWASRHPGARPLRGRRPAYAVPLGNARVVVRHSWHGGLLAPLTQDWFLAPTRAPYELAASRRLASAGVPTPEMIGYAIYRVGPAIRRVDVLTREIPDARDLAAGPLTPHDLALTAKLLRALTRAGAIHADLNLANVLVSGETAYVIDVDRVRFARPGDAKVLNANLGRLARSARKLGAITERDLASFAKAVQ